MEKCSIYYHSLIHKIQYIYLVFQTPEMAHKVYEDKFSYETKFGKKKYFLAQFSPKFLFFPLEKSDVQIQTLTEGLYKIGERFAKLENVLCILRPISTLEVAEEIPRGNELVSKVSQLVQTITQLQQSNVIKFLKPIFYHTRECQ
jgi:hypothetical protein